MGQRGPLAAAAAATPVLAWCLIAPLAAQQGSPPGAPAVHPPQADQPSATADTDFARLNEDRQRPAFEVAVVTMRGPDSVQLTLYSSVHIADGSHYAELQRRFTTHESLLYELVGPRNFRPYPGMKRRGNSVLTMVQKGLRNALDLSFQLDHIDYRPDNFVHADLTPREFERIAEERGESFAQLMWRSMVKQMQSMRKSEGDAGGEKFDLVSAFRRREGRHYLRMAMAKMLNDLERTAAGFAGKDGESLLVEIRNKKALDVLRDEIAAGKRNLGLYYGAAHMPDFVERLVQQDFTIDAVEWLPAWDLRKRLDPSRSKPKSTDDPEQRDGTAGQPGGAGRWRE